MKTYCAISGVGVGVRCERQIFFLLKTQTRLIINVRKNIKNSKIEFALKSLGFEYYHYLQLLRLSDRTIVRTDFSHRSGAYTRAVTPHR
jgi:hypothetical protein